MAIFLSLFFRFCFSWAASSCLCLGPGGLFFECSFCIEEEPEGTLGRRLLQSHCLTWQVPVSGPDSTSGCEPPFWAKVPSTGGGGGAKAWLLAEGSRWPCSWSPRPRLDSAGRVTGRNRFPLFTARSSAWVLVRGGAHERACRGTGQDSEVLPPRFVPRADSRRVAFLAPTDRLSPAESPGR